MNQKKMFMKKASFFSFRPQQGLTIMNAVAVIVFNIGRVTGFPSPTGVNYYEWFLMKSRKMKLSFRPQQGLTIMNMCDFVMQITKVSFRPQQGLTIMNKKSNLNK